MTRLDRISLLGVAALLTLPLATTGCATDPDDPDEIAAAIEQDNGGLDMEDEAPMFGDQALFESAGITVTDQQYTDAMADDLDVVTMSDGPDAMVYDTTILWGQIPGNLDNETPHDWSGVLRVNRGAIIVRRLIRFEPATDAILPRDDRQVVPFTSITLPHNDGLRLTIIDPTPEADEPLTLEYANDGGVVYSAAMSDLLAEPQGLEVDDSGNRVVAVAFRHAVDFCQYGFLGGRWHKVADGRGIIVGRVVDALGEQIGYLRGLYGRRLSGQQVFFGKYIDLEGHFKGLFAGHYRDGHFAGRWLHRSGELGVLGGEYRETIPGPETGGYFLGRWAETSCNVPLDEGE